MEVPKFRKTAEELETNFDKWLYILKNLHKLDKIPIVLQNKMFQHLFEQAEIAKFDKKERLAYESSLKEYRDLVSAIETAKEEARIEARAEGLAEVARNLISLGFENEVIIKSTGLSEAQIEQLRKQD